MAGRIDLQLSSQNSYDLSPLQRALLDPEVATALQIATKILGNNSRSAGAAASSPPLSARASGALETASLSLGGDPASSIPRPKPIRSSSPSVGPTSPPLSSEQVIGRFTIVEPWGLSHGSKSKFMAECGTECGTGGAALSKLSLGGGPGSSVGAAAAKTVEEKPLSPVQIAYNALNELAKTLFYKVPKDPEKPGHPLPFDKRTSVFPYREIRRSLSYFAKPETFSEDSLILKEMIADTQIGQFIQFSEACLKKEVLALHKKYDHLCTQLIDLLNLLTETLFKNPSIEAAKNLWEKERDKWLALLNTKKSGREMGLGEDLAHFSARLRPFADEDFLDSLRHKYSDDSVRGIEFPNPFSNQVLFIDKNAKKTWWVEFGELDGFLTEYQRLLIANVSYLTQLVRVINKVRVTMDTHFGQCAEAIVAGMKLPDSLKLLRHP